ncbi:polysaccharide biosynthesis protein [Acidomonas methanolica]|uniref:Polysaccharide biosynthesis nucleotide sugar epimerase dehydratase n=1 Tax=Acidomonas methanolica NBRC 104435 TaxID=1231351 RepID=A0A023D3Y8_ACIMT|nr:polysaccharide biosynthesis protein [Acidomonas methanolica]GAJ28847.1 polysaccharide biosynthesis nucleotide sugar epimerase dehydratase [Acidomonas methanolica NBRC 104435]
MRVNASQQPPPASPPVAVSHRRAGRRIVLNIVLDGLISGAAAPLARFLADPYGGLLHPLWFVAGGAITLLISGLPFRMPQQYWRFSGVADLIGIGCASVASAILFSLGLLVTGYPMPSPTFPAILALVLLVGLGGVRMATRLGARLRQQAAGERRRVLLIGSDQTADLFMRAVEADGGGRYQPLGLLTGAAGQVGRRIQNVPILGTPEECDAVLARLDAQGQAVHEIVFTDPHMRGTIVSRVLERAHAHGVAVKRAPSLTSLQPAARVELRPMALEDLLNRPQWPLDLDGMARMIGGRVVLVTGAGGTIGSELVRQIASLGPSLILLLDHSEYALWQIDLELSERAPEVPRRALVADVREAARVDAICAMYRPELVFHAAALKHVPIVEANPCEGVLTNAVGTRVMADASARHGARAMVLISTDKAVNPSSLMGASKRCAEIWCQALDKESRREGRGMRCVTVRFGNVLGSTGSVVPLFQRQLAQGGPLTVTHPEMTRYFMTVPEAVGLVLQASVRGMANDGAGETDLRLREGGIFVLDMGEPVRILDLARQMIRLAGLRLDEDVAIRFTGLRPGEKLFEELFHGREAPVPTDAPGLKIATPRSVDPVIVAAALDAMERAALAGDASRVLEIVRDLVPEFAHNPTGEPDRAEPARPSSWPASSPGPLVRQGGQGIDEPGTEKDSAS